MTIYFIRDGDNVKIGYTSRKPQERLKQLQTGNPTKLKLIGSMRGTQKKEAELHRMFKNYHVRGEWFVLSSEIERYIVTQQVVEKSRLAWSLAETIGLVVFLVLLMGGAEISAAALTAVFVIGLIRIVTSGVS